MQNKFSIITPSYNQGEFLEETILSIIDQNYSNLEIIVIDGGSTDNSVEIIKKYEKYLTYWVSEKDKGQTHAINKGFKIATGDFVNWINSDDLVEKGALEKLNKAINKNPKIDVIYGDYSAIDKYSNLIYKRKSAPFLPFNLIWGRQLSSQPAVFFKRELLDKFGYLDEKKHFCMDTEFWIRMFLRGVKFYQIKEFIGITRVHGDAKTTNLQEVLKHEHFEILKEIKNNNFFIKNILGKSLLFTFGNYFARFLSALLRLIFRFDFTFLKASTALRKLEK